MLGALTEKMGWLKAPELHQRHWQKVLWFSLAIGIPLNIFYALGTYAEAAAPATERSILHMLVAEFMTIMAFSYVALVALFATTPTGQAAIDCESPRWVGVVGPGTTSDWLVRSQYSVTAKLAHGVTLSGMS